MKRCVILLLAAIGLSAAEVPRLSSELVCDQLASPTWVGTPPADATRLVALEQRTGLERLFDRTAKAWKPAPVLTVDPLLSRGNEQGLLGMAFHPQFAKNGFIYLYYTAPGGGPAGHVEVARFTVHGDVADPTSKLVILTIDQPRGAARQRLSLVRTVEECHGLRRRIPDSRTAVETYPLESDRRAALGKRAHGWHLSVDDWERDRRHAHRACFVERDAAADHRHIRARELRPEAAAGVDPGHARPEIARPRDKATGNPHLRLRVSQHNRPRDGRGGLHMRTTAERNQHVLA